MGGEPLFDDQDRETFRLAVETWGRDAQTDMAVEELGEAIQELAGAIVTLQHLKRDRADWNDVHDELADIRIMYEQLRWYFGPEFVDERVQQKMDRLRERLADAGVEVAPEP